MRRKRTPFTIFPFYSFEKLVNTEGLSYLPNLYFKQYKAMDELTRLKQDFPEQRVLLERPTTRWEYLLNEMSTRARLVGEMKKFRVAEKSHLARQAKNEIQRAKIRMEEQTQFQRVTSSLLAQSVVSYWQEQSKQAILKEEAVVKKEEAPIRSPAIKVRQDDIFVDREEEENPMPPQQDLFDDLLNQPVRVKAEEQPPAAQLAVEHISSYMNSRFESLGREIQAEPLWTMNRKFSIKKISENVRKRLKMREEDDEQVGRSLNSATVLLSNIMKLELQWGRGQGIDILPSSEWGFELDRARGEERWQLRWSQEQLQKMEGRGQRGNRRGRVQEGMLALNVGADEHEFEKLFDKNIRNDRCFPPSLQDVPIVSINQPQRYYNEFSDPTYEHFIMRFNKRRILKEFVDKANMIFPESYSHEEVDESETIATGKIFVHPPDKVLERLVWKVSGFRATAGVRNSINSFNVDFNRMVLMTFLVRKYLANFGNAWDSVSEFVAMHPIFANHQLTPSLIQEVYQVVSRLQGSTVEIQLWDKKVLPYEHHGSCENYRPFVPTIPPSQPSSSMVAEGETVEEEDFPFDNYSSVIRSRTEDSDRNREEREIQEEYAEYARKIKENALGINMSNYSEALRDQYSKVCRVREKFRPKLDYIPYTPDFKPEESTAKVTEELLACLKGQIKVGTPFRKKKNINERNNELVKILQALRNKSITGTQAVNNPKPNPEANKLPNNHRAPQPIAPVQAAKAAEQARKTQRSPEKRLGGPSKGGRKSKDQDDKK